MAGIFQLKPSFAGGELSDSMYGRVDINKYDNGAAMLKNFLVQRYGGARNRNGFRHIAKTAGGKRAFLVPFTYSNEQSYVVELTAGHCRFYRDGGIVTDSDGNPYTIENTLTDADLEGTCKIKYTQSADVMFIVHPEHPPMTLTRYGANDWRWEQMKISGGPFDDMNITSTKLTPSGTTATITITASADLFKDYHVGTLVELTHYKASEYKKGVPGTEDADLTVNVLPSNSVYVESFGFWAGHFTLEKYDSDSGEWQQVRRQENNHSQNYNFTEKNEDDHIVQYRITSTEFDTTIWEDENEMQTGFVTIQSFGNDYSGIAKITAVNDARNVTAEVVRTLGAAKVTSNFALGAWNSHNGYPMSAGFYEDRLIFAGSRHAPQTFWTSKTGDYYNFGTSIPLVDDDAVTATLNGGHMNGIKAMVAFGELIFLTAGGEYKVSGGSGKSISPTNTLSQPQEYRGVSDISPVTVGSRIIYVQQQGNIVRDLAYSYEADKYTGDDLNLLCSHLFDGHKVTGMTYQQVPDSVVWFVRDDGMLLGMTYIKEQDIYAWHRHTMKNSKFVNICSSSGEMEDELYAVIERGGEHYVVVNTHQESASPDEQFYVDDGVTVRGESLKEISGLDWLEGEAVAILADGNVLPEQVVKDGRITLSNNHGYNVVHVGLPIDAQIKTLPIEFQGQDGAYLSRKKRVGNLGILFKNSRGGMYGLKEDRLDEIKWRMTENWGQPVQLYTGKKKIVLPAATWDETQQLIIKQDAPLPMTVLAIVPEIIAGG